MSERPPDIDSAEWAWPGFRSDVFQLVVWGYQIAENEIRRVHLEEDITGLIRRAIRKKLETQLPPRFRCYSAHNEDPVDDAGVLGKKRPRVDILVESGGSSPRKRYRLEAKRCARKDNRIDWYVKGVEAFLAGRYAIEAPEAGLLGLMQSDDVKYWKSQLSNKLQIDGSLACQGPLEEVDLLADWTDITVSRHRRNDGSGIELYHVFLDCKP